MSEYDYEINGWWLRHRWAFWVFAPWVGFDHIMCKLNQVDYRLSLLELFESTTIKGDK